MRNRYVGWEGVTIISGSFVIGARCIPGAGPSVAAESVLAELSALE